MSHHDIKATATCYIKYLHHDYVQQQHKQQSESNVAASAVEELNSHKRSKFGRVEVV